MVGKKFHELLSRDVLSRVGDAAADDDEVPLLLICPLGGERALCNLVSIKTPADGTAGCPERSRDASLTLATVPVPADDLGVSGGIVCHKSYALSTISDRIAVYATPPNHLRDGSAVGIHFSRLHFRLHWFSTNLTDGRAVDYPFQIFHFTSFLQSVPNQSGVTSSDEVGGSGASGWSGNASGSMSSSSINRVNPRMSATPSVSSAAQRIQIRLPHHSS